MARAAKTPIINGETRLIPIDSVMPHPRNANQGDLGKIIESIRKNGFYGAILVQTSTSYIVAGSHRWRGAQECGLRQIPATFIDVDDATALRIMLADNRTSRLGTDNQDALAVLLQEMLADTGTLEGSGFDGDDLDQILTDLGYADMGGDGEGGDGDGNGEGRKCPHCGGVI